ncbi:MAG TPA: hypothetical protein PKV72_01300 [Candidatus Peribacteria bacterium]|nr:hypothetical protein [Candidatus Peribacteria bacterium]
MNASVFRDKIRQAGYLPGALAQYLVSIADTLQPDVRERIAGKVEAGAGKLMAAAARAADEMSAIAAKSSKAKKA